MTGRSYRDRADAGSDLVTNLGGYASRSDVFLLALPRGCVPVAYEVARALGASLDVFLVRKQGVPGDEELAMGAIASGGLVLLNEQMVRSLKISPNLINKVISIQRAELERRYREYRGDRSPLHVRGKTVIVIDDGLATGASMRDAVAALRQQHPSRLVVAVPIAAPKTYAELRDDVDEVVCARTPEPFRAVGVWYLKFSQTTDDEVRELLRRTRQDRDTASQTAENRAR
jgi:predicted phosphoribosyltransferase